ncbi:TIR domain-containing protein [Butyrivibrio sp. NC3005]|uniref:TIR domain-containing protein n=1 Tax=Butyrivibrio sp. NC3005 TaxID=1280685 RepID=UPI0003FBEF16|nr:TIR domain-containing protein [Butyrivibrio sp. NC3005]
MNIQHYNAFISYKHAPADIKIAKEIQHQLEHFKIPHSIRKRTGIKKIERVFRDQEELPLTSNLGENISMALRNSDYLIVICSTSTKLSTWVPREISEFLKTHSIDKVLTVLVDGEPSDVIPPILQKRLVTYVSPQGFPYSRYIPLEPLSCDYRGSIHHARRHELPRLVASLLNCSYDEIIQRQRGYRIKRNTIILSTCVTAITCAMCYLLWSNAQITQHLINAQIEKSKYLANESSESLKDEDRATAVQLALAALPSNKNKNFPTTPEARLALSNAVNAYNTPSMNKVYATWRFEADNRIEDFFSNETGEYIIAYDNKNEVYVWNFATKDLLYTKKYQNNDIISLHIYEQNNIRSFIVVLPTKIAAYSLEDGKELWYLDNKSDYSGIFSDASISKDKKYIACSINDNILLLDPTTGKINSSFSIGKEASIINKITWSEDSNKLCFKFSVNHSLNYKIGFLDIKHESISKTENEYSYIPSLSFTKEGKIIFIVSGNDIKDTSNMSSYKLYDRSILYDSMFKVYCINEDCSIAWNNDLSYEQVDYAENIIVTTIKTSNYKKSLSTEVNKQLAKSEMTGNVICVTFSNRSYLIDSISGICLKNIELPSPAIRAEFQDESYGSASINYYLSNGDYAMSNFKTDQNAWKLTFTSTFCDNIKAVKKIKSGGKYNKGHLLLQNSSTYLILYENNKYDKNFEPFNQKFEKSTIFPDSLIYKNRLAIISSENQFYIFDANTGHALFKKKIDQYLDYKIIGNVNQTLYLIYKDDDDELYLYSIDEKFNENRIKLPNVRGTLLNPHFQLQNNKLWLCGNEDTSNNLYCVNLTTLKTSAFLLNNEKKYDNSALSLRTPFMVSPDEKKAVIIENDGSISFFNFDTLKVTNHKVDISDNKYPNAFISWSSDSSMVAIGGDDKVISYSQEEKKLYEVPVSHNSTISLCLHGDKLLVLSKECSLECLLAKDGSLVDSYYVMLYSSTRDDNRINWTFTKANTLFLYVDGIMNEIDTNNYHLLSYSERSIGYCKQNDRLYNYSYESEPAIGSFPHYNLSNLIDMGKEMLGSHTELSDKLKVRYGLK